MLERELSQIVNIYWPLRKLNGYLRSVICTTKDRPHFYLVHGVHQKTSTRNGHRSHLGFLVASVDPSADAVGLTETDTFFILDLIGDVVSQEDHDEYAAVRQKNQAYIEVGGQG